MAVTLRRYRFTVDEYDRMAEVGLLTQCDRVELLDGAIVEMSPIGDRHASVVARISSVFSERLGRRSIVWGQNPLGLRVVRSVPQPDVTLLRPRADFYASGRPGPDDALLLIEVMDTSELQSHLNILWRLLLARISSFTPRSVGVDVSMN